MLAKNSPDHSALLFERKEMLCMLFKHQIRKDSYNLVESMNDCMNIIQYSIKKNILNMK